MLEARAPICLSLGFQKENMAETGGRERAASAPLVAAPPCLSPPPAVVCLPAMLEVEAEASLAAAECWRACRNVAY